MQFDEFGHVHIPMKPHYNQGNKHVHYLQKFLHALLFFFLLVLEVFCVKTLNKKSTLLTLSTQYNIVNYRYYVVLKISKSNLA